MKPAKYLPHFRTAVRTNTGGKPVSRQVLPQKLIMFLAVMVLLGGSLTTVAQRAQQLQYAVHHQGHKVGELVFRQKTENDKTTFAVESLVKIKMLLSFTIQAWESSVYEKNLLQSSSLVRHVNGKTKVNRQIRNNGNGLTVLNDGSEKELKDFRVRYNMHCLYVMEPVSFATVFSDNHQRFIPITRVNNHHYKLSFPDGGSNEYFYENGICQKVKVKSHLFDAEFVLASP